MCSVTTKPNTVPDCFNNSRLPQLGQHIYRQSQKSSEIAFASRNDPSYFSKLNTPSSKTIYTSKGGGYNISRRKRAKRKHAKQSMTRNKQVKYIKRCKSRSYRKQSIPKTRKSYKKTSGGGYFFELHERIGGQPPVQSYQESTPPYFGNKAARARGVQCEPRTHSTKNVGFCNSQINR